ncbi:MerR family transcriptional regulator [Micromonospora sp. LOL_028]
MRISDLSRQAGVPVPTIKFYLRERLLPPGEPTGRNQAIYGEMHLRRLRLIRAFTTISQLDLTSVRTLLTAIENEEFPLPELFEIVNRTQLPQEDSRPDNAEALLSARDDVEQLIEERGWRVDPDAPVSAHLAQVLVALRRLGCDCDIGFFTAYAEAAERLIVRELDLLSLEGPDRAAAVARSVLLEVALISTRRMALEHHAELRFG